MEHHFNVTIAKKYNINIATFLHNIAFWTQHNIANKKNFHDGLYWTYNSYDAFTKLFPYWSYEQIRLIITKCVNEELLVVGNYNKSKYDQTKWYALTEKGLELFNLLTCEISQMDESEIPDGGGENHRPIPDSNPDSNPTTTTPVVVLDDKILTDKLLLDFLKLRKQSGDDQDERSDYEFLEQCKFHLENNSGTDFTMKQSIRGLKTIIKQGFITPPAYIKMVEKRKREEENSRRIKANEEKSLVSFYETSKFKKSENGKIFSSKLLSDLKKR